MPVVDKDKRLIARLTVSDVVDYIQEENEAEILSNVGLEEEHSGGRYVAGDAETAAECRIEGDILKRLAPQCIEDSGGLFVAVEGGDPAYAERFPDLCAAAGIPCETLSSSAGARARAGALRAPVRRLFGTRCHHRPVSRHARECQRGADAERQPVSAAYADHRL